VSSRVLNSLFLITGAVSSTLSYLFYKFFHFWKAHDYGAHAPFMGWAKREDQQGIVSKFRGASFSLPPFFITLHLNNSYGSSHHYRALVGVYGRSTVQRSWAGNIPPSVIAMIVAWPSEKLIAGYVIVLFFSRAMPVLFRSSLSDRRLALYFFFIGDIPR